MPTRAHERHERGGRPPPAQRLCLPAAAQRPPGDLPEETRVKLLFVADPLESFKTYKDSTYAMMLSLIHI